MIYNVYKYVITSTASWTTISPFTFNIVPIKNVDFSGTPGDSIIFDRCASCVFYAIVDKWEYAWFIGITAPISVTIYKIRNCDGHAVIDNFEYTNT